MPEVQIAASAARQHLELDPGGAAKRAGRVARRRPRNPALMRTANPRGFAVRVCGLVARRPACGSCCATSGRSSAPRLPAPSRRSPSRRSPAARPRPRRPRPTARTARRASRRCRPSGRPAATRGVERVVHPLDGRILVCDLERDHGPGALAPEGRDADGRRRVVDVERGAVGLARQRRPGRVRRGIAGHDAQHVGAVGHRRRVPDERADRSVRGEASSNRSPTRGGRGRRTGACRRCRPRPSR